MQKIIDFLSQELISIQSWRSSKWLVDTIKVDSGYGFMPIGQLANITLPDSQSIRIEPWDKTALSKIETAIYQANTGLVPSNQGDYLLVKLPPLTQESRMQLSKQVGKLGEDTKARLRQTRQDELKSIKRWFEAKEIAEDEKNRSEKKVDEATKKFTEIIDDVVKAKQDDIMKI